GATRVIVSDVTELPSESLNLGSPMGIAERLLDWLFLQPLDSLGQGDLAIRSLADGFGTLDFSNRAVDSLVSVGRRAAAAALAEWGCTPPHNPRPTQAPERIPVLRAIVHGHDDAAATGVVSKALALEIGRRPDIDDLSLRIRALGVREVFRDIW